MAKMAPADNTKTQSVPRRDLRAYLMCALAGALAVVILPDAAWSNSDDEGFVLNREGKHFYALNPVRTNTPTSLKSSAAKGIKQGFFPLNRKVLIAPTRQVSVLPHSLNASGNAAPHSPKGNDAKILTLFGASTQQSATSNTLQDLVSQGIQAVSHIWPLPKTIAQHISSGFGIRSDPFTGRPAFHGGIDIAAPAGTPILATANGIVKEAGRKGGYGNYVLLSHTDGTQTMYSHLQSLRVQAGNGVRAGQVLGTLGSTGRSTGAHLDYRLIAAGKKYNPMQILAGKEPKNLQTITAATSNRWASNNALSSAAGRPSVRVQSGVRIITPRERLAQAGGFIRVH